MWHLARCLGGSQRLLSPFLPLFSQLAKNHSSKRTKSKTKFNCRCASSSRDLKTGLKHGDLKVGLFVGSSSPLVAEQLSHSGYDWVLVDLQHSPFSYEQLGAMLMGISTGSAVSMVRVGGPEDRIGIQQALDLGAGGVMVPSVNTKAEVEQAVGYCLYPTEGVRSIFYPMRSTNATGLTSYLDSANEDTIVCIQVETKACLDNLEDILSVPGIDAAFVGPVDLCYSMGLHQKYSIQDMFESQEMQDAVDHVLKVCSAKRITPGNFAFPSSKAARLASQGFTFLAVGTDLGLLLSATSSELATLETVEVNGKAWKRRPTKIC